MSATTKTMELTEAEQAVILKSRRERDVSDKRTNYKLRLLDTAAKYARWMETEGSGNTYSTFCSDFGYDAEEWENRGVTHEIVTSLMDMAFGETKGTINYKGDDDGR